MPRNKKIINPIDPCHIGARCNNKDWFSLPIENVWSIMGAYLYFIHHAFGVRINSFVLMNNHFHLLATFPNSNVGESMQYFMRETSRAIAKDSNRINHVYGGNHFCSQISSYSHYCNVYKYVYRNPVEAGLVDSVLDYQFSSLFGLLGQGHLPFPVVEDEILFNGSIAKELDWLNGKTKEEDRIAIKRALRKNQFAFPNIARGTQAHPLNFIRY